MIAALTFVATVTLPRMSTTRPHAPGVARLPAIFMTEPAADDSMEQFIAQVKANVNEGEVSTRGEGWFIGQACLLLGVVFAPAEPIAPAVEFGVGLAAIGAGGALGIAAVKDLSLINLTPWPKPVERNELKTEGVYSLCRHPMYTCLISICFGLSLLSLSFERLLLTTALFALLSFKAGREEVFLNEMHGERYRAYSAYVPQFFPTAGAVQGFVKEALPGASDD